MRPKLALASLSALFFVAVYGNVMVEERGVAEDILLDEGNPVIREKRFVDGNTGFTSPVTFKVSTDTPGWEKRMAAFLAEGKKSLPGTWVSPLEMPALTLHPDGNSDVDVVSNEPCMKPGTSLGASQLNALKENPACGSFVWTIGKSQLKTIVLLQYYPPRGQKELEAAEDVTKLLLRGESFPWWRFWDIDIHSNWEGIDAVGWIMARFLIHTSLLYSSSFMFLLSIPLVLRIFKANMGEWKLAWIATAHILGALLVQRALMVPLGIKESPFIILAYSIIPIAGPSFLLRVYHEGKSSIKTIWFIALAGMFAFANLLPWDLLGYEFGFRMRPIVELAFLAMVGILIVALLGTLSFSQFIPVHVHMDIRPAPKAFDRVYEQFLVRCLALMRKSMVALIQGRRPYAVLGIVVGLFFTTILLLKTGGIPTRSDALGFIAKTNLAGNLLFFNEEGGPGQGMGQFLLTCDHKEFVDCLRDTRRWIDAVRQVPMVRTTASIVPALEDLSLRMLGETYPSPLLFASVWEGFQNQMDAYRQQFWYPDSPGQPKGIRIAVGIANVYNDDLKIVFDGIRVVSTRFPKLHVSVFDNDAVYGEVGNYLTNGMTNNMVTSIITVFAFIWILARISNPEKGLYSWAAGLIGTIPFQFALSVYLILGIALLGRLMGSALDMAAACIVALLLDAGMDFSFYFIRTLGQKIKEGIPAEQAIIATFDTEGLLILRDGLQNAAGFALLMFGLFKPVRDLGSTMVLVTVAAVPGTLVLMAPVLVLCIRTYWRRIAQPPMQPETKKAA